MTHAIAGLRDRFLRMPITIFLAVLLGIAMAQGSTVAYSIYDWFLPVVDMHGELVSKSDDAAIIHISGSKNRQCVYAGVQAYSVDDTDERRDANKARVDAPETGATKPVGDYDLGYWKIWPTDARTKRVEVFVTHFCDGRQVMTKIADVPLKPPEPTKLKLRQLPQLN